MDVGGRSDATHHQKFIYVADELAGGATGFDYRVHFFGPYSDPLSECGTAAVKQGLLEDHGDQHRPALMPTAKARSLVAQHPEIAAAFDPYFDFAGERIAHLPSKKLGLKCTAIFYYRRQRDKLSVRSLVDEIAKVKKVSPEVAAEALYDAHSLFVDAEAAGLVPPESVARQAFVQDLGDLRGASSLVAVPEPAREPVARRAVNPRDVFIVRGRDDVRTYALEQLLRVVGLRPQHWNETVRSSGTTAPHILEAVRSGMQRAQAVIALITPDEQALLRDSLLKPGDAPYEKSVQLQPRPNVYCEIGLAAGIAGERLILVEIGPTRPVSDLAGLHTVRLDNDPRRRQELLSRLADAGCPIDWPSDWTNPLVAGDFEADLGQLF